VYLPDVYLRAASMLSAEGKASKSDFPFGTDGYRPPTAEFIDGVEYDGRQPNAYLQKFSIGLKGNDTVRGASSGD